MAGYYGYSMSNNAVNAYNNGEKPESKWTKADILEELDEQGFHSDLVKKLTVAELRDLFLRYTSWHHTSSMYNCTDFYEVSVYGITDEDIAEVIANRPPKEPKQPKRKDDFIKAEVSYLEWSGTRKHPKAKRITSYAIIVGIWAYLPLDYHKKRTDGSYFCIEQAFTKAPKGTAETFKEIERKIKNDNSRKKS